jgi:hypothetical protein
MRWIWILISVELKWSSRSQFVMFVECTKGFSCPGVNKDKRFDEITSIRRRISILPDLDG